MSPDHIPLLSLSLVSLCSENKTSGKRNYVPTVCVLLSIAIDRTPWRIKNMLSFPLFASVNSASFMYEPAVSL